jgi:hypothetical protein
VGSHVPILAAAIARTQGPVLECGCGWWSTSLIHLAAAGRSIVSCETDAEWLSKFVVYQRNNHRFVHVRNWREHPVITSERWSVAFVDCSPGEERIHVIQRLKPYATYIVAHDVDADIPPGGGNYGWKQLEGFFKYEVIFKDVRPWTTVYSDVEEFKL